MFGKTLAWASDDCDGNVLRCKHWGNSDLGDASQSEYWAMPLLLLSTYISAHTIILSIGTSIQ